MLRSLVSAYQKGAVNPSEVISSCRNRIDALAFLNAMSHTIHPSAEDDTYNVDTTLPFAGIPYVVKDNYCTRAAPTTCCSKMLESFRPPYDATVVKRLDDAGGIILGKTNMDEFAMGAGSVESIFGPVFNPWRHPALFPEESEPYVCGGSSGGSAVAVAAGLALAALGSDTGGSTRTPAAHTGLVGFKPTYGVISRHGLIPLVNSLDCPAILARSVDDAYHVLSILAGEDPLDATSLYCGKMHQDLPPPDLPLEGLKIGIPREYSLNKTLDSDIRSKWLQVADVLENLGARVSEISLPHTRYAIACYSVLCATEVASNMARYDGLQYGHSASHAKISRDEGLNDVVRGRILAGNYFLLRDNRAEYFDTAARVRRLVHNEFDAAFEDVDFVLTPTVAQQPLTYHDFVSADNRDRVEKCDLFTMPANLAGIPAVSFPVGLSSRGFPVGIQLMADRMQDYRLLSVAKRIQEEFGSPLGILGKRIVDFIRTSKEQTLS